MHLRIIMAFGVRAERAPGRAKRLATQGRRSVLEVSNALYLYCKAALRVIH